MNFVTISCLANTKPLVLDIPFGTRNRVQIQQFPRNGPTGTLNQQWSTVTNSDTGCDLFVSRATGTALEVGGNGKIFSAGYNGGVAQQWNLSSEGSVTFLFTFARPLPLISVPGPFVMDLPLPGGIDNVSPVQIYVLNGGANQRWSLIDAANMPAFAFFSRANHMVLDVPGFAAADGVSINQYTYNGGSNQLWEFVRTDGSGVDEVSPQSGQTYFIRSICSAKVLEFPNGDELISLQQASLTCQDNQKWLIIDGRNSSFLIQNVATEKFLTRPDSSVAGVPAQQRAAGAGADQEWWPKVINQLYDPNPLP